MPEWFIDILKTGGCAALVFFCFYLVQKASAAQMAKVQEASAKAQEAATRQIAEVIKSGFEMVKILLEQQLLQTGYLEKIDTKVSNNHWCPIVRKVLNGGGNINEYADYAVKD